jgi:hypothetical protein
MKKLDRDLDFEWRQELILAPRQIFQAELPNSGGKLRCATGETGVRSPAA